MKKATAALITGSVFFVLHAEIPFNSTGQQTFKTNYSDLSWNLEKDVNHNKEVLDDGTTIFSYDRIISEGNGPDTVVLGSESDSVTYDAQGNLISENYFYGRRPTTRRINNNYTYSAENKILANSKSYSYGTIGFANRYSSNSTYFYGCSGPVIREIRYTENSNIYRRFFDTLTIDYEYDNEEKLIKRVTEYANGAKATSNYQYTVQPTGETVITENRSFLDTDGNWRWAHTHPIKTYCSPNDTIIEEYTSSTGILAKRIYSNYTANGALLESSEYRNKSQTSNLELKRYRRKFFHFN